MFSRLSMIGCLVAAAMLPVGTTAAAAPSRCGADYTVVRGDTLYGIAQRCRVTLAQIMDLNPALGEPRDIEVGTALRLEPADAHRDERADREPSGRHYRVQEGDTVLSIAQALDVSLFELLAANEDLDPLDLRVGQVIEVPGDEPGAAVSIEPSSGAQGTEVTVRARHLRPNDWVIIGVGPEASEWEAIREVQAGPEGAVSADVSVPDWADPGTDLIFVVDTDRGVTLKSGVFDVTERDAGNGETIRLEGRVREGVECYTLETPEGDVWSLVSGEIAFTAGDYVEVEGTRPDMSICMQGVGTVEVTRITEVEPPARERDPTAR